MTPWRVGVLLQLASFLLWAACGHGETPIDLPLEQSLVLLTHADAKQRLQGARELGRFLRHYDQSETPVSHEILHALRSTARHSHDEVRRIFFTTLINTKFPERILLFQTGLKDRDRQVREQALLGLARFEAPGAVTLIASVLHDADEKIRMAAVQALRQCGTDDRPFFGGDMASPTV